MHPGSVENGIVDTPWRNLMTSWRVGSPPYVAKPANYAENDIGAKVDARVKAFGDYVSTLHREYATTNHWYVQILAVHPDHQGKGYSRLLLDFISANADVDNVICYLESFGEKSKSVYEKHGYELQSGNLCEIHVKNDEYEKFSDVGGAFIRFPTQTPE
jgi:GNAT superfamily N-acetyltransferase